MRDVEDRQPLHRQIYCDLERRISTGEIRYMEQIPPLPSLCARYGVSAITVRKALDELARDGLIIKHRGRGKGTFAIKRLARTRIRVMLIASFDIYKSPIETCHEVFDLLAGIREAAAECGSEVQFISSVGFDSLPKAEADTGYLIIAMTWAEYEQGALLAARHQAPCVLVNPPQAGYECIRVDMEQGAFLGVNYLIQLGHRRIAYLGATHGDWFAPRISGYHKALAANGLESDPALVCKTNGIDPQQDWQALDSLLALPAPPTAVFATSDHRALHLMAYCKREAILVPQQLSICGYDNIQEASSIQPAVTTIHHPRQELGKSAVEMLARLLKGETPEIKDVVISPQLMVRDSCGAPRR
jgi:DNA-binding LacI/PurR family transcriptional regulator